MATHQTLPVTIQPIPQSESRPNPDPTVRTSEQLLREIALTRERFHAEDKAILEKLETRLNAMDKAIELLQRFTDKQPTTEAVDLEVKALTILVEEKFNGVNAQLDERQRAVETLFNHNKAAADERNKANSESIAKSEAGFTKQLDQLQQLMQQQSKSTNDKIEDIKLRQHADSGQKQGAKDIWGYIMAAIMALIALAALAAMLLKQHA